MKIRSVLLFLCILIFATMAMSQTMIIHTQTGTQTIRLSDIVNITFTDSGGEMVTDIDGNTYRTVKIGDQVWMAENLKVTKYRNGEAIPHIVDASAWANQSAGAWCAYDNNDTYVATYGRLYNWYAVADPRGLAPAGWHIPSDAEWKQLEMFLGMSQSEADKLGERGSDQGGQLKESGTAHWYSPNAGATNTSGFTGLPGGHRYDYGHFGLIGDACGFWSSTEYDTYYAWYRGLYYDVANVYRWYDGTNKHCGFSVRCVLDY